MKDLTATKMWGGIKIRGDIIREALVKSFRQYFPLLITSGLVLILDQVTKALIRQQLALYETWVPWDWMAPYARIVHWYNTGVAFGLLQDWGKVFAVLALIVAVAIVYYYPRIAPEERLLRFSLGLQLGGAVGNLIDRVMLGHVTDFISVGRFPVFNIADASITIGVGLLILSVWLQERGGSHHDERNQAKSEGEIAPSGEHH